VRRWWAAGAVVAATALAVAASVGWHWLHAPPPVAPGAEASVAFRVERGEDFASVAQRLEEQGLVFSALRFRVLARLTGADRRVRAGTYTVDTGTPPGALLEAFVEGRVRLVRLTVPEGWRLEQIAAEVERVLGVPADTLRIAAADEDVRRRLRCRSETLEGYLFPETYHFPDGASAREVVDGMTRRFEEVWEELGGEPREGMDRHDVVTLASIVEAETAIAEEKPRVAAVYLNRLELGWKLQADPTVRYGLKRFTGRLYYKHLDIDTPYNTYMHAGLPPGPIGAPGRASLEAVLHPLEPCRDLYFVASGGGGHVFSRTRAEHERAKQEARGGR
jgi:UPF0755 protein